MARIDELLVEMAARGASDLHLTSTFRPFIREQGDMVCLEQFPELTPESNREMIMEMAPEHNRREFDQNLDTDFSYELPCVGRFRVNVFMDRFGIGAVLRLIPSKIPAFEELNLPPVLREFCHLSKGLVLVTGPTGSGKSTTLAALIDFINRTRNDHIITIEDPVEFVHSPKGCLINQREVHSHTRSFPNALRAALREDPDIVLVGELRDLETMEIALETAETGHLVFGTLHTNTAASTVDRIIDKFPSDRQNQIRTMLASSLKAVVAQTLCKKKGKGRVAAVEVLVVNTAVASNIREGKTFMIPSSMQTGKNVGMQLFNDSLLELVLNDVIEPREAYLKSTDKDTLLKKLSDNGIPFDPATLTKGSYDDQPLSPQQEAEYEARIRNLIAALQRDPNDLDSINNLAWILSTCPAARFRKAGEAVRLAERAKLLARGEHPAVLDTLAAAYAEAHQFDKAQTTARLGMEMARTRNEYRLVNVLAKSIALYEQGRALRVA